MITFPFSHNQFAPRKMVNIEMENPAFEYQNLDGNVIDDSIPESDRDFFEAKVCSCANCYHFSNEIYQRTFSKKFHELMQVFCDWILTPWTPVTKGLTIFTTKSEPSFQLIVVDFDSIVAGDNQEHLY